MVEAGHHRPGPVHPGQLRRPLVEPADHLGVGRVHPVGLGAVEAGQGGHRGPVAVGGDAPVDDGGGRALVADGRGEAVQPDADDLDPFRQLHRLARLSGPCLPAGSSSFIGFIGSVRYGTSVRYGHVRGGPAGRRAF